MTQLIDPDENLKMVPEPTTDWLNQRELAELLGCSERTASVWAQQGRLKGYEHGCPAAGRRKYSKRLVMIDWARCFHAKEKEGAKS